jgi:hypothetical protein
MRKLASLLAFIMLLGTVIMLNAQQIVHGNHVVVIDRDLPELDVLITGVKPGSRLIYLDNTKSPLASILKIIKENAPVSSLHILSHGKPGTLIFSSDKVTVENLEENHVILGAWKEYFINHGDVLLYGCEVAKGNEGIEFIKALAVLTGLDIAASDNLTGSYLKGGDWYFEVRSGRIESSLIISKRITAQYEAVLNIKK